MKNYEYLRTTCYKILIKVICLTCSIIMNLILNYNRLHELTRSFEFEIANVFVFFGCFFFFGGGAGGLQYTWEIN